MTVIESLLIQKLQKLPPNRFAEVVDFVEFLAAREERQAAARRLGESMAQLDALNLPPLTDDEVEEAVQESRRERRREAGDEAPSYPRPRP